MEHALNNSILAAHAEVDPEEGRWLDLAFTCCLWYSCSTYSSGV